jgi:hypothetical protein
MVHYIYKTTNLIVGTYYIGCHTTTSLDNTYLGSGTLLKKSIKCYGRENFLKEILYVCSDAKEKWIKEAEIVNEVVINDPLSMNLKLGGEGGSHKGKPQPKHSEESKRKISIATTGKVISEETKEKIRQARAKQVPPMLGKQFSDDHKRKLGDAHRGEKNYFFGRTPWNKDQKISEETKEKVSQSLMGRTAWNKGLKTGLAPWLGKSRSEETKQKISKTLRERGEQ